MGDVAEILGIGGKSALTGAEEATRLLADKPKSGKSSKKSKPKGMNRELFSLMGVDGIAPAVVTNKGGGPAFKTKRLSALQGKWIWAPFRNSARSDDQIFYHWVKADMQQMDYSYAKFNIKIDRITYTEQEYEKCLHDSLWTRSETDHLMHICHKYDLRWPVIVDRYDAIPSRTVEDLQARYYGIISRLKTFRLGIADSSKKNEPHTLFDLEYERVRRMQQELFFRKTKEDEQEEAKLREELKTIDSNIKKLKKSTKVTAAPSSDKNPIKSETKPGATTMLTATGEPLQHQPLPGRPCLQSSRLAASEAGIGVSKSLVKKMNVLLKELLGIPDTLLPTKTICDMHDQIRADAVCLLTLQTALAKKEKEAAVIKAQHPTVFPVGGEVAVPYSITPNYIPDSVSLPPSMVIPVAVPPSASLGSSQSLGLGQATPKPAVIVPSAGASKHAKKVTSTKRKTPGSASASAIPSTSSSAPAADGTATATTATPSTIHIEPVATVPQKHASKRPKK
eukprot:gene10328-21553_t